MCPYETTPLSTYEEKIKITNSTNSCLNNIQLMLDNLNINITQYKVVRERGSLTFLPSEKLIELGNLVPDESAELYFTVSLNQDSSPSSLVPLKDIKIAYTVDSEEPTLSNLDIFLKEIPK